MAQVATSKKDPVFAGARVLFGRNYLRVISLMILSVIKAFLELLGLGIFVPIILIKFGSTDGPLGGMIGRFLSPLGISDPSSLIVPLLALLVVIMFIRTLAQVAYDFFKERLFDRWRHDAQTALIRKQLEHGPVGGYESPAALQADIKSIEKFINKSLGALFEMISSGILVFCMVAVAILIDTMAGLLVCGALLLIVLVRLGLRRLGGALQDEDDHDLVRQHESSINASVTIAREIQMLRKEQFFIRNFEKANQLFMAFNRKNKVLGNAPAIISQISFIIIVAFAIGLIPQGTEISNFAAGFTLIIAIRLMPRVAFLQKATLALASGRRGAKIFLKSTRYRQKALPPPEDTSVTALSAAKAGRTRGVPVKREVRFVDLTYTFYREIGEDGAPPTMHLSDVNLTIEAGTFVAVVGESGAGKSTLLELFGGIRKPFSGSILVDGERLGRHARPWKAPGYLSQRPSLLEGTVVENVAFGVPETKVDLDRVNACLDNVGLSSLQQRDGNWFNHLSGGERQRLGLARALYMARDVLLLDEPTSNLDLPSAKQLIDLIRSNQKNMTIIMISHQIELISGADKIIDVRGNTAVERSVDGDARPNTHFAH